MGKTYARVTISVFSQANCGGLRTHWHSWLGTWLILLRISSRCLCNLKASLYIVRIEDWKIFLLPQNFTDFWGMSKVEWETRKKYKSGTLQEQNQTQVRAKSSVSMDKVKSTERTQ